MTNSHEEEFNRLGEAEVRGRLDSSDYRINGKLEPAKRWLAKLDHAARTQEAEIRKQQMATDVEAVRAAKSSARAAWVSAVIALFALCVAGAALVVSLNS